MTPRPYQVEGALWLAESNRALLGDPPGLGKTCPAILAAKIVHADTVIVICPAIAVANWHREWRDWWPGGPVPLVVSYDKVVNDKKLRVRIAHGCDVLILDEGQYLKNPDSLRTRAIYRPANPAKGLASRAKFVWVLSGTFMLNDVTEYWPHLRALFPELIPAADGTPMGRVEFMQRFTHWTPGLYNPKIHAVKNKPELARILRVAGMRREIEDVLPELPALVWGQVTVPASVATAEIARLEDTPEVHQLRQHIAENENYNADSVHLSTLRKLIGQAKAPWIASLIDQEMSAGYYNKIAIWAQHLSVIEALERLLSCWGVAIIHGGTSPKRREEAIHLFQTSPEVHIFLGQIQAAGTAITLTAANQVLFAESSWVPAETQQAAKRCHRYGQTLPVFARLSALARSIDEPIAATQTRKLANHVEIGDPEYAIPY